MFGDSNLKIFASFGIYYDVMKLYMAELTFGGWKRKQDYYALQNPDWRLIAASGDLDDAVSQGAGGTYAGTVDFLPPSFDRVDPDLKPTAQREISLGAEKKLMEDLSLSVRLVNKHLLRTIEDVGVYVFDGTTLEQQFYITNPGYGVSRPVSQGGLFSDDFWACPKATREYYGVNISLEKRFSNNWQGGFNYTWSRVKGPSPAWPAPMRAAVSGRTSSRTSTAGSWATTPWATSSTAPCPRTGPITSRPTAPIPSPSG